MDRLNFLLSTLSPEWSQNYFNREVKLLREEEREKLMPGDVLYAGSYPEDLQLPRYISRKSSSDLQHDLGKQSNQYLKMHSSDEDMMKIRYTQACYQSHNVPRNKSMDKTCSSRRRKHYKSFLSHSSEYEDLTQQIAKEVSRKSVTEAYKKLTTEWGARFTFPTFRDREDMDELRYSKVIIIQTARRLMTVKKYFCDKKDTLEIVLNKLHNQFKNLSLNQMDHLSGFLLAVPENFDDSITNQTHPTKKAHIEQENLFDECRNYPHPVVALQFLEEMQLKHESKLGALTLNIENSTAFPGNVLLYVDMKKYERYKDNFGQMEKLYVALPMAISTERDQTHLTSDGDILESLVCPMWPPCAMKWKDRVRPSGWPSQQLINNIIANGCLIIKNPHPISDYPRIECRLSFSFAELLLARSLTPAQRQIYRIFKLLTKVQIAHLQEEKPPNNDHPTMVYEKQVKTNLDSYCFKTIFWWTLEEVPLKEWMDEHTGISTCFLKLVNKTLDLLSKGEIPNYFIENRNLLALIPKKKINEYKKALLSLHQEPAMAVHQFYQKYVPEWIKPSSEGKAAHFSYVSTFAPVLRPKQTIHMKDHVQVLLKICELNIKLLNYDEVESLIKSILNYYPHLLFEFVLRILLLTHLRDRRCLDLFLILMANKSYSSLTNYAIYEHNEILKKFQTNSCTHLHEIVYGAQLFNDQFRLQVSVHFIACVFLILRILL